MLINAESFQVHVVHFRTGAHAIFGNEFPLSFSVRHLVNYKKKKKKKKISLHHHHTSRLCLTLAISSNRAFLVFRFSTTRDTSDREDGGRMDSRRRVGGASNARSKLEELDIFPVTVVL